MQWKLLTLCQTARRYHAGRILRTREMSEFTLYRLLDRVFPRSYNLKLFLVAFIGTHLPLLATLAFFTFDEHAGKDTVSIVVVLLTATLIGTAITLTGLHFVLKPIETATEALKSYEAERTVRSLPVDHDDQAGQLLKSVHTLMQTVELLLHRQERAAVIDPLTGLANRRGFRECLDRLERHLKSAATVALFVVDIDRFKSVNDTHGHVVGDLVLADVGRILADHVREPEIAARHGGEEFVVFLPDAAPDYALARAERLLAAIEGHEFEACPHLRVTASAGIAVMPASSFDIDDLFDRADRALYRAKRSGRNKVVAAHAGGDDLTNPEDGVIWAAG
jgi:diguanylate cyclase (GGDEF)-like protein